MIIVAVKLKATARVLVALLLIVSIVMAFVASGEDYIAVNSEGKAYIKWVDFNVPYYLMEKTLNLDIRSQESPVKLNWIELMAYCSAKCGGNYKNYKSKYLTELVARLNKGEELEDITEKMKYFKYYLEAYTAIFKEFVGAYSIQVNNGDGTVVWQKKYGLKAFSPIARGYGFTHYDDFLNRRSYGYTRKHFGNDLMGSIGTPIIAVESGVIEALGWNMYGGWRIGIRSFDEKRYYYYAHMRKGHPYNNSLYEGKIVKAGDVIGYLGMTGYSTKPDSNNVRKPHLHFGMQLIFDESQKDGVNQIWIDVYNIVKLLQKNRSSAVKDPSTKDYNRMYDIDDPSVPD